MHRLSDIPFLATNVLEHATIPPDVEIQLWRFANRPTRQRLSTFAEDRCQDLTFRLFLAIVLCHELAHCLHIFPVYKWLTEVFNSFGEAMDPEV
jgi:hypothetical protein